MPGKIPGERESKMVDIINENSGDIVVEKPWYGSGVDVFGENSAEAVMAKSSLNWEVEGRPLLTPRGNAENFDDLMTWSNQKAIVRKTDDMQMGIVGKGWQILQNHEIFAFIDELVRMGLVKYSTAGQFKGGKVVYVVAEFRQSEILPGDVHKGSLLFTNAFDGTFSVRIGWMNIRIVCWNTFIMASKEAAKSGYAIRHTASMKEKIEKAKNALIAAESETRRAEMFQRALTRLRMTGDMWTQFSEELIPDPEKGKKTRAENARNKLLSLSVTGRGQDIPGVAGTGYAALSALTEYANYERTTRGKTTAEKQASRFQATLFGSSNKLINQGIGILGGFLSDAGVQVETAV
jgi:phage/plasmid-like protein (TIGR03299 family)